MTTAPLVELTCATVDVPLERPVRAGRLVIDARQYCCVRARLADGAEGAAFVLTRGLDVAASLATVVLPRLSHVDGLRVGLRNLGWDGAISRAAAAVTLALLDAGARSAGEPVWRLLAPDVPVPAVVPAGVAIGYAPVENDASATETGEAALAAEGGAAWVKLMGGPDPEVDLARLRRVRAVVGEGVGVALDVNGAWPVPLARQWLPRLADEGLAFVEEPVPYELGLDTVRALAGVRRPPLALGEVCASVIELEALAATGLVEHLRPDATVLGGPEPFARVLAATAGPGLVPHFWPEVHRHLVAGFPGAAVLECVAPGAGGFGLERFVDGLARLTGGGVTVPDEPGFGYRLDWTVVETLAATPPTTYRTGDP